MLALLTRSVHGLAHSLRSLPRETVEILEYVFTLLSRFMGTNAFLALTRNTPSYLHLGLQAHVKMELELINVFAKLAGQMRTM